MSLAAVACLALASSAVAEGPLTLEQAIGVALEHNEVARSSSEREAAAEARVAKARAFFWPDFALSGTYTRRAYESVRNLGSERVTLQSNNALSASVTGSLTVFDMGGFPLYQQARLERDATRLGANETRRLLGFEVATAFFAVLGSERIAAAAVRRREIAEITMTEARARVSAGLAGTNDATRAELEQAAAERDLVRAQADVQGARLRLENLLAAPVPDLLEEPEALAADADAASAEVGPLLDSARRVRADVRGARLHAQALRAAAEEPGARFVPSLSVLGQARATNEGGFSNRNLDGSLGVTLNWSLWDGGERAADSDERRALAAIGELDLSALERGLEFEVRDALRGLELARAVVRHADTVLDAARRNREEVAALFRQGMATAFVVADANLQEFDAEVERVRARYGVVLAFLEVRRASGLDPFGRQIQ